MKRVKSAPDLFAYLDCRRYLADAFRALRTHDPRLSYRAFAKAAGYSSPNLLQLILSGRRRLVPALVPGTCRALGLGRQESAFFADLAAFTLAEGFEEKDFHYRRMSRSRRYAAAKPLEKGGYEYLEQWYHPVVRELLAHPEAGGDMAWIAAKVSPPITTAQAARSAELLESLGLVRRDAEGRWIQSEAALATSAEVGSLAAANYHRSLLRLAAESLEAHGPADRDVRAVTLGIPRSALPALKRRMEEFWRDLVALGEARGTVEEVVQICLQLFPLTRLDAPAKGPGRAGA